MNLINIIAIQNCLSYFYFVILHDKFNAMNNLYNEYQDFILPAILVIGGVIIGFIIEKFLLNRFKKFSQKTSSQVDDVLVHALKGMIIFWITALGIYISIHKLHTEPKIKDTLKHIYWIMIIFSFTLFFSRLLVEFTKIYTAKVTGLVASASVFTNITRIIVFSIGFMIILQYLGISITPIITALGVGGLAVALALQDTLSNLFSGIQILVSKQVKPGDYIKIDTNEGYVRDITWRNTVVETGQGNIVVFPNSKFAQAIIINYYQPQKPLGFRVEGFVSYHSDLDKVEELLTNTCKKVLEENEGGDKVFIPTVRFYAFGENAVLFRVNLSCTEYNFQFSLNHLCVKAIHKTFQQNNINIPLPQRVVEVKNKA